MRIPIYKAEKELAAAIQAHAAIAYASPLEIATNNSQSIKEQAEGLLKSVATNEGQIDLHYLRSVLVSVGWNKNDDVFDKVEVWLARNTPEDKPLNIEHDPNRVRGHITGNYVIDEAGNTLDDSLVMDELPNKYHVITSAVLYKFLKCPDQKLEEEMKQIIADVKEGKLFVSMEALFSNFDYAVTTPTGESHVVARNEESAFLTKHLRAYGGNGKYNDHRIGRILRNIVFSGKGIVLSPANPESIIFKDVAVFKCSAKEFSGYKPLNANVHKESKIMATEIEILQSQIKSLEASMQAAQNKNSEYEQRLKDLNEKQVKAQLDELNAQIKSRDDKLAAAQAQIKTEQEARQAAEAKVKELSETHTKTQAELSAIKAEHTKATRVAQWVERTGVEAAIATKSVDKLSKLSDEEFKDFLETQPAKVVTPPVGGKTESGAKNADTTVLDNVEKDKKDAPLNAGGVDNGSEQVRASLSKFIGKNYLRKSSKVATEDNKE